MVFSLKERGQVPTRPPGWKHWPVFEAARFKPCFKQGRLCYNSRRSKNKAKASEVKSRAGSRRFSNSSDGSPYKYNLQEVLEGRLVNEVKG